MNGSNYGYEKYCEIQDIIKSFDYCFKDKFKINLLMNSLIPLLKEVSKYPDSNNIYILGIKEAYIENSNISVRTINKKKINKLLDDIENYVSYYIHSNKGTNQD
jgi:hypothetical protein